MVYLIVYDLIGQETCSNDYVYLYKKIKSLGNNCRVQKSAWLIKSNLTAKEIYNNLVAWVNDDGKLIVTEVSGDFCGYFPGVSDWVLEHLNGAKRVRNGDLVLKSDQY